jgi:hypothetical protein
MNGWMDGCMDGWTVGLIHVIKKHVKFLPEDRHLDVGNMSQTL